MDTLDEALSEAPNRSIFKRNLNPIRVGINLHYMVREVARSVNYS